MSRNINDRMNSTKQVTCPICDNITDLKGLHGHMRFKHDLDSETVNKIFSRVLRLNDGSGTACDGDCDRPATFFIDTDDFSAVFVCQDHLIEYFERVRG